MPRRLAVFPPAIGALLALGLLSCAGLPGAGADWRWFGATTYGDPWTDTVQTWQERESLTHERIGPVRSGVALARARTRAEAPEQEASLARSFVDFHLEQRRAFARDVTAWIQAQAREHFRADGSVDRWATLEEVLETNGDDCDGLALLAFNLLRDFGFGEGEIYQAIVYRAEDDQYHMVTLWFEDPDDPWVIDPTAAMVDRMVRISEAPGWRPLKLFTESEEYTVRPTRLQPVAAPPPR